MIHYPYLTPETVLSAEDRERIEQRRLAAVRSLRRQEIQEALQVRV